MIKHINIIPFLLAFLTLGSLWAQEEKNTKLKAEYFEVNAFVEDNESCLKCHGETKYSYHSDEWGKTVTKGMYPSLIVDRDAYYSGVHASFMCSDCHMGDFSEFPHSMDARMEDHLLCMDCHGYDETYAQYHFEVIEEEVAASIHNLEGFSCWKCHDPHSYKAFMRNADDIHEAILFDNNMCLECHANFSKFSVLTDREEIVVVDSHDWLPNQTAHFATVRCIECHTQINDTILIAHQIMPKADAVKNCTECHSKDSRLMHTLYKFESLEERQGGFMNGIIINDSYVIGANQNILLNWMSFIVLGMTLLVIAFHTYMRVKTKKKS